MVGEFIKYLEDIQKEKGISVDECIEALEQALASAYKKNFNVNYQVIANVDRDTGSMQVFSHREIVEEVEDYQTQISLEDAKQINAKYKIGDFVDILADPAEFGRIAAQTARQVVLQRLREAERNIIYNEFVDKKGQIVTGMVRRVDRGNIMVEIGKIEAILTPQDQIAGEHYKQGDSIKVYITDVNSAQKGPQLYISRNNPAMVEELFKREVPEIDSGVVEIMAIAREPGSRTKIAVVSNDDNVDARGACIGPNGDRVRAIVDELGGEKIDIIQYSDDIATFIKEALSPADVTNIKINEDDKICIVVVPDNQLSLAIGKEGQNARLSAKLTGWKIDIKSETAIATS
ncbi:MAG: transcription termination factor NusA [Clostridiales bacterium]|jgi:N utilization substance protein A|nr:transcription termination factor NusA [Clostridiales bacterium]